VTSPPARAATPARTAPGLHVAGGYLGVVCGALAMYGSFAITANSVFGRVVAPLGARS
jgi:uncharacterized protein